MFLYHNFMYCQSGDYDTRKLRWIVANIPWSNQQIKAGEKKVQLLEYYSGEGGTDLERRYGMCGPEDPLFTLLL